MTSGAGTAEVYYATWKNFDELRFLDDTLAPTNTASSLQSPLESDEVCS